MRVLLVGMVGFEPTVSSVSARCSDRAELHPSDLHDRRGRQDSRLRPLACAYNGGPGGDRTLDLSLFGRPLSHLSYWTVQHQLRGIGGAGSRARTGHLPLTRRLLYQMSYPGGSLAWSGSGPRGRTSISRSKVSRPAIGRPRIGAGTGDRTPVLCLEGRCSAIELRPRGWRLLERTTGLEPATLTLATSRSAT